MEQSLVSLISDLIRMESTHPAAVNRAIAYCADWLEARGVRVRVDENQGLKMVTAACGGTSSGPTVVLNGHVDVVPGNPADFVPRIEGGKLFGRGSYDMLGAVGVMMMLAAEWAKRPPACSVKLKLVPDEETGGRFGTGYLVDQGHVGDFVICGEPTNLNIAVQAKGILQLRVAAEGKAAHGSRPWLGKNAIMVAMEHYKAIEALPIWKKSSRYYAGSSLNMSQIQAGQAVNQVPDVCVFTLDIRYLPELDREGILPQIQSAVPGASVSIIQEGQPVCTDEEDMFVKRLKAAVTDETGAEPSLFGQDGSADTRYYSKLAIPAVEFGPVGANHHGPNEFVEIGSLSKYYAILNRFISNLHGED